MVFPTGFRRAWALTMVLALVACTPTPPPAPPAVQPTTAPSTSKPGATQAAKPTVAAQPPAATQPPTAAPAAKPTAAAQPRRGGSLTIGMATDVLTLDLPNFRSQQDLWVGDLIFDTLLGYDQEGKIQPRLASSWRQVDASTYRFTIRPNVKFTDGSAVTPTAVKASFERARVGQRQSGYFEAVESITVEGDDVVFKLKRPFAPFAQVIPLQAGAVQSPDSVTKFGEELGRNPVGSGPYRLVEWVPSERLVLERNPDYWGPAPYLDRIVFRYIQDESTRLAALEAGEVDVIHNPPPHRVADLAAGSRFQVLRGPYAQSFWLGFTHSHPILQDARVRRAIAMAVDRKGLVTGVTEGLTREASGFIPPELMPSTARTLGMDLAAARQLLAEAGHPNGFQIELWSPIGRYLRDKEITEAVQAQLKGIGIDAQVKLLDYAGFIAGLGRHEAGLFVLGWGHIGSPDTMLRAVFGSKSTINWSDYKNPRLDELVDQAVGASTLEQAVSTWQQVDQALIDDAAGVPIYWSTTLYAARPNVRGFVFDPYGNLKLATAWVE
jgi:peptide/nickel transport system substrate-binding protein